MKLKNYVAATPHPANSSTNSPNTLLASLGADTPSTPTAPRTSSFLINSSSGHTGTTSATEDKALSLLGAGVVPEQVANALGVTPSRIAQLLAKKHFADKVAELRFENLQKHNIRDANYDSLEDALLEKLDLNLNALHKPESILRALHIVNGAKRRGQSAPQQVTNQQTIVNLVLPKVIAVKFAIDINNQVTKAGEQELLTMPSGNLLKRVEDAEEARLAEYTGDP